MIDQIRKTEMIRSIEDLQLSHHLIWALDDVQQAESIVEAVASLQGLTEQWN